MIKIICVFSIIAFFDLVSGAEPPFDEWKPIAPVFSSKPCDNVRTCNCNSFPRFEPICRKIGEVKGKKCGCVFVAQHRTQKCSSSTQFFAENYFDKHSWKTACVKGKVHVSIEALPKDKDDIFPEAGGAYLDETKCVVKTQSKCPDCLGGYVKSCLVNGSTGKGSCLCQLTTGLGGSTLAEGAKVLAKITPAILHAAGFKLP